ncbi:MAG: hypothetical protein CMB79_02630 [Filomicrobium sp.]|nr:hypothetical protein [Filomicrobium sp.]
MIQAELRDGDIIVTKGGCRLLLERVRDGRVIWRNLETDAVGTAGLRSTLARTEKIETRK